MNRRRPQLQCPVALAVDRECDVHHLDVLRGADGAVRVGWDEGKSKDATIIVLRLGVEVDHGRHTGER
jgi:hypothetical protein